LRYYRQQFSPEAAYQSQGSRGDIFSMYDPESMNQYVEAVSKRQERFDAGKMAEAAEIARLGETETYDLKELNNRIKSFESGITNLVNDKYNGVYGAAANDIAKKIGTERSNPFYHFNKQKVEMGKAYLDAKMKLGSKFMSSKSPFDVSFQSWQSGDTFEFTPVNRDDIVKDAAMEFSTLQNTIQNDPTLQSTAGGQYFLATMQSGLKDPVAVRAFMESEEGQIMIQNIVDKNPEIAKLDREQVLGAVTEGAYSAIGKTQKDFMANRAYMEPQDLARMQADQPKAGKTTILGDIPGPKGTKTTLYGVNRLWGTTTAEINQLENQIGQVDSYLTKSLQKGDLVGRTEKDSKLLKDLSKMELHSYAFIPTGDPNDPVDTYLNILGTPTKTKGNSSPQPVEIAVKFGPGAVRDRINVIKWLAGLDPSVISTYMSELQKVNPEEYMETAKAMNKK
jgi:hypothetical protein